MDTHVAAPDLITTWREAEFFAANHMRTMGFTDAEVTKLGVDGGVDVTSAAAIAQVKHFTGSAVGAPVVQQLIGAAKGKEHAIFYALNGFTNSAISLAEETRTALFTYSLTGAVEAVSTAGNTLMDRGYIIYDPTVQTAAKTKFVVELQTYGQSVINKCSALSAAMAEQATMVTAELTFNPERLIEVRDTWAEASTEFQMLTNLIVGIGGVSTRKVTDFTTEFTKIEAIAFQLAKRIGLDYNEL